MSHAAPKSDEVSVLLARFPGPLALDVSKRKFLVVVLAGAVFIAGGAWLIHHAASPAYQPYGGSNLGRLLIMLGLHGAAADAAIGWTMIVAGGLVATIGMLVLIPGAGATGITLDANGFTMRSVFGRMRLYNWNDVDDFAVLPISAGFGDKKMVGFNRKSAKGGVSARWFGCNSTLPGSYGLTVENFVRLMALWRERALSQKR
jgi:hypothetical protein